MTFTSSYCIQGHLWLFYVMFVFLLIIFLSVRPSDCYARMYFLTNSDFLLFYYSSNYFKGGSADTPATHADIIFKPAVVNCCPPETDYTDMELPEFMGPCVFPCELKLSPEDCPPHSFTFVLTNAAGLHSLYLSLSLSLYIYLYIYLSGFLNTLIWAIPRCQSYSYFFLSKLPSY